MWRVWDQKSVSNSAPEADINGLLPTRHNVARVAAGRYKGALRLRRYNSRPIYFAIIEASALVCAAGHPSYD